MTPAESAIPAVALDQAIPERVLRNGEQVILTVKPSAWFILLNVTQPLIILCAMLVFVAFVEVIGFGMAAEIRSGLLLGLLMGIGLTLLLSGVRWFGRLYVLTDRRLLRICGITRVNVYEFELSRISEVGVAAGIGERIVGIGSLKFRVEDNPYTNPDWVNIAQIQNVAEEVRAAVTRARKML